MKHQKLWFLLALLSLLTVFSLTASAAGSTLPELQEDEESYTCTDGNFTALIQNGTATITGWNVVTSPYQYQPLLIPDTICGYPVTAIANKVFSETYLQSVQLPDTLQTIGHEAFYAASILGTVEIPASVTSIGTYAFSYCWNLKAIHVDPDNSCYSSLDGVLYNKQKTILYNYPCGKPEASYTVPDTVELLYCTSLAQSKNLKDLYVLSPVVRAMTYTFYYAPGTVHCNPDTMLYRQIRNSNIYPPMSGLQVLQTCDVTPESDGILVKVRGDYTEGIYLLAAFDGSGKLREIRTLSGLAEHVFHFPTDIECLQLFSLDNDYAPKAADQLLWEKQ